jgi:hypothetical protein
VGILPFDGAQGRPTALKRLLRTERERQGFCPKQISAAFDLDIQSKTVKFPKSCQTDGNCNSGTESPMIYYQTSDIFPRLLAKCDRIDFNPLIYHCKSGKPGEFLKNCKKAANTLS